MALFLAAAAHAVIKAAYPDCHPLRVEPSVLLMAALYIAWWALTRMVEEKHRGTVLTIMVLFLALPYIIGPGLDQSVVSGCPEQLPTWVLVWRNSVLHYKTWLQVVYPIGVLHDGALMGHGTPKYFSPVLLVGFYYLFYQYYFGLLLP